MRITDVRAHALSSPVEPPQTRAFHGGERRILKRDCALLSVETSDGLLGYAPGLATSSAMKEFFSDVSHDSVVSLINDDIAAELVGTEFDHPIDISQTVGGDGLPETVAWDVRSMVDVALYDIFGQVHGEPIYRLLNDGDSVTETLPLYASGGMYMSPEEYAAEARQVADEGFFGYKYRPGIGPDGDRETLERIQSAVGDDIEVMADAHTWWKMGEASYSPETVRELVDEFADAGVYWVEEPVEPTDYDGYRSLHDSTGAALAGGESEQSPAGLVDLAETGAVDFLQGDVRHHGGYTGCWTAVDYCLDSAVRFVPHNFGTDLGLVANAHLAAADPKNSLLEYPLYDDAAYPGMYPFPLATDILETDLHIENGELEVPDGPGLGVDIDRDVITDYPRISGPWTEFHYD